MKQQYYIIYVKEGYEMKTAQMLGALDIKHRLPFKSVEIDGILHLALSQDEIIHACFKPENRKRSLFLPYVIEIALG